jgi:8-oxo-dGTP pyrophosphatase MutT (NUDIX family)
MGYLEAIERYQARNEQEGRDQTLMLNQMDLIGDLILERDSQTAHMTSSGLILNPGLDKMLMIYHKQYDSWTWTGGHADGIDDPLDTAIREAKEETGLENLAPLSSAVASIDVLPVFGHMKKGTYVPAHLHFNVTYVLIADENAALRVNEEETNGVKWVPVDQIADYSSEPYFVDIYQKIIAWGQGVKAQDMEA